MTREALSAFLPSNFWPVLRFQQYDYLHTRIIHSEIIPLIYLPCCISELLRNFHILKFVRTRVHSREIGELWRTWLTFSYLSLIGELTPQYVIFWNGSYERGRFPHLPQSHHQAGPSSHEYNMRRTHDATYFWKSRWLRYSASAEIGQKYLMVHSSGEISCLTMSKKCR